MGQRGPKPGQYKMRPIPAGSPVAAGAGGGGVRFTPGAPTRPKHLTKPARKVWDRTARELGKAGILTHADADVLAAYSDAVANLEKVTAEIGAAGPMVDLPVRDRYGKVVGTRRTASPAFRYQQDLVKTVARLAGELGLTPAARSRLAPLAPPAPAPANKVVELRDRIAANREKHAREQQQQDGRAAV